MPDSDAQPFWEHDGNTRQRLRCSGGRSYIIRPGDTFYSLAQRFGVAITRLIRANPHTNPNILRVGQAICIPPRRIVPCPSGRLYTVRAADTLFRISRRFGIPMQRVINANPHLSLPGRLPVGETICLPAKHTTQRSTMPPPTKLPEQPSTGLRCLLLRPIGRIPEAEGVTYLNFDTSTVLLGASALPNPSDINCAGYVAWLHNTTVSLWLRLDMAQNGQVWTTRLQTPQELSNYDRVVVTAEQLVEPDEPDLRHTLLTGDFRDACAEL